jgi:hypothetical protein
MAPCFQAFPTDSEALVSMAGILVVAAAMKGGDPLPAIGGTSSRRQSSQSSLP